MSTARSLSLPLTGVIVCVMLFCAFSASAETLHVHPGESIQAAINLANPGDTILVHPGTYTGMINFLGKAVALRSTGGPEVTVLDGQQAGTVVKCQSDEGPDTILEGFLITGGLGMPDCGGMYIFQAAPTVTNCIFRGNHAQYGGGVFSHAAQPTLSLCVFEDNVATSSGGGMYCFGFDGDAGPTLIDCCFEGNEAFSSGGGLRIWDCGPTLTGCVFISNFTRYSGGGVANGGSSEPVFEDCVFEGNRADTLFSDWDSFGGGMSNFEACAPTLINCLFVSNSTVATLPRLSRGGALANGGSAQPELVNCTLSGNHANLGDAMSNAGDAHCVVKNSILWNDGDEIMLEGSAMVTISYSAVRNGWNGVGNITDDPRLDNSRLQFDSPCIDTGDPTYNPPGGRDLDGHARVLRGRVDMGAHEFGIGDYDGDRDVDVDDFLVGFECMLGPDVGPYDTGCEAMDFEYDADVDLGDFAAFQRLFGY